MDECYKRLYIEIFVRAVKDSTAAVKCKIVQELKNRGFMETAIHKFIHTHKIDISGDVRKLVYAEAQEWPHTKIVQTEKLTKQIARKYIGIFEVDNGQAYRRDTKAIPVHMR